MKLKNSTRTATPAAKKWKRIRTLSATSTESEEAYHTHTKPRCSRECRGAAQKEIAQTNSSAVRNRFERCFRFTTATRTEQPTTDEFKPKSKKRKFTTDAEDVPPVLATDAHRLKNIYSEVYAANPEYADTCALCATNMISEWLTIIASIIPSSGFSSRVYC